MWPNSLLHAGIWISSGSELFGYSTGIRVLELVLENLLAYMDDRVEISLRNLSKSSFIGVDTWRASCGVLPSLAVSLLNSA